MLADRRLNLVDPTADLDELIVERRDSGVEHRHRVVETPADLADVGIDLGDLQTRLLLDAGFGSQQAIVEAVLGVVDFLADRLPDIVLEAADRGIVLLDQLLEALDLRRNIDLERCVEFGLANLEGLRHLVEIGHHASRLLVELAQVGVEPVDTLHQRVLTIAQICDQWPGCLLNQAIERSGDVVEATRLARLGVIEALFDGGSNTIRVPLGAGLKMFGVLGQTGDLLREFGAHLGTFPLAVGAQPIDFGNDCRRVPLKLGLHGGDQALSELVDLRCHLPSRSSRWTATGSWRRTPSGAHACYRPNFRET